jgi:hypothetical protein
MSKNENIQQRIFKKTVSEHNALKTVKSLKILTAYFLN